MNTPSGAKYSPSACAWDPLLPIEQPPGDAPFAKIEPPALAALEVREVEDRGAGIMQRPARADPIEIVERLAIARQQEMVAVVDDEAKRRIEIGPATAAREGRRLMHDDLAPGVDKAHGGAQAGDPAPTTWTAPALIGCRSAEARRSDAGGLPSRAGAAARSPRSPSCRGSSHRRRPSIAAPSPPPAAPPP